MPNFPTEFSACRRYSDFLWIAEVFCKLIPYVVIPPLPSKKAIGRFEKGFVELRRRSLERFLRRVAGHELLVNLPQFIQFCSADEDMFGEAKKNRAQTTLFGKVKSWLSQNPLSNATPNRLTVKPSRIGFSSQRLDFNSNNSDPTNANTATPTTDAEVIYKMTEMRTLKIEYQNIFRIIQKVILRRLKVNSRRCADFQSLLKNLSEAENDEKDAIVIAVIKVC